MKPKRPKITPAQLSIYTEPLVDIYIALEEDIFQMIAKRLKTSKDISRDNVFDWQVDKMNQLRLINEDTIKALSETTGLASREIRKTIRETGIISMESVDQELKDIYPTLPIPSDLDNVLESFVRQTFRELDNFVNQTLITTNFGEGSATRMYRKIVEETTGRVLAGTTTINKAVAETTIKWANKGINTSFIDKGGNVWGLERYARTVLRSTTNRTYNELRMSRMKEHGVDLVLMSSHPNARPACARIQGTVISTERNPSNPKYDSIYNHGYGEPWGVRGINCAHMFFPFVEGLMEKNQPQYSEKEALEGFKKQQKQRYYERQIRDAKRSLKIAEEVGDKEVIQHQKKLVRNRQARMREFINESGRTRQYDREQIYS